MVSRAHYRGLATVCHQAPRHAREGHASGRLKPRPVAKNSREQQT